MTHVVTIVNSFVVKFGYDAKTGSGSRCAYLSVRASDAPERVLVRLRPTNPPQGARNGGSVRTSSGRPLRHVTEDRRDLIPEDKVPIRTREVRPNVRLEAWQGSGFGTVISSDLAALAHRFDQNLTTGRLSTGTVARRDEKASRLQGLFLWS